MLLTVKEKAFKRLNVIVRWKGFCEEIKGNTLEKEFTYKEPTKNELVTKYVHFLSEHLLSGSEVSSTDHFIISAIVNTWQWAVHLEAIC